jgi:cation:H+ antiporter
MLGVSLLLVALSLDGELSQYDGLILIGSLIAFTIFTYKDAKKQRNDNDEDTDDTKNNVYLKAGGLIALGVTLLGVGASLTVENAVVLAKEFGLSEKLIGLTVIAIGTSLPELITSIIAIRKGHADIGVGNIIGSNIYNILMIMGVGAALGGVVIASNVFVDYAIMIAFSASLLVALKMGVINRTVGIILTIAYVVFLVVTFII